jgi:hypothetical protein
MSRLSWEEKVLASSMSWRLPLHLATATATTKHEQDSSSSNIPAILDAYAQGASQTECTSMTDYLSWLGERIVCTLCGGSQTMTYAQNGAFARRMPNSMDTWCTACWTAYRQEPSRKNGTNPRWLRANNFYTQHGHAPKTVCLLQNVDAHTAIAGYRELSHFSDTSSLNFIEPPHVYPV